MYSNEFPGRTQSFTDRLIGAARLDDRTYEEVEHDTTATGQAAAVVIIAAIAAAIGGAAEGNEGLIAGVLGTLIGWVVSSAFVYFIGTQLLPSAQTQADLGQVLRTMGFAEVPSFLLVLGFIPVIGALAALVVFVWAILTRITAIRAALEVSTGRAVGIGIMAVLIYALIVAALSILLNVTRVGRDILT
jgi:hypothetical protein